MSRNSLLRNQLAVVVIAGASILPTLAVSPQAVAAERSFTRAGQLASAPVPQGSAALGALNGSEKLSVNVVLAPSNPLGIRSLLANLYDPKSSEYHHWLGRGQFAARFAPSNDQVAAVENWLQLAGLHPSGLSEFAIKVTGTADQFASALSTSFTRYRTPSGHVGYVAQQPPLIPSSLAYGAIQSFEGLDTVAVPHPESSPLSQSTADSAGPQLATHADGLTACSDVVNSKAYQQGHTMDEFGAAYGIGALLNHGLNGVGVKVGLFEMAPHSASDVSTYASCFGLSNPVSTVKVDGGSTSTDPNGIGEADLDIEEVATQAPGASIVSYEGDNTLDIYRAIVADDAVNVVSVSWGECETGWPGGAIPAMNTLFYGAAAQGQTVLVASGDSGSETCYRDHPTDTSLAAEYPASDPWVTAVGGTTLGRTETVWNNCQADENLACGASNGRGGAAGGGMSIYEDRPSFQPNVNHWVSAEPCSQYCREVPDISANAGNPMIDYSNGQWIAARGTSFATPMIAGIVADKNEGCTTSTGVWTPALYALAAQGVYGSALNDVQTGDNDLIGANGGLFPAALGYDLATGLGSPKSAGLSCPEVNSIQPATASAGTHATINGLGLERANIYFGSTLAQVISASATQATVVVPSGSGGVSVSGTSYMGTGNQDSGFTYPSSPPVINGSLSSPVVGISSLSNGTGYWLTDSVGEVSVHGWAQNYGSMAGHRLNSPISHIVSTPDGLGYWLVAGDGGTFAFGDAGFYGSMGGQPLNAPVVDMAPTPDNKGYWLVASDGGIFAFGDAQFHGSMGGQYLNQPVVGMSADAASGGYWEVATDGGIFAFGAPFFGSTGSLRLNRSVNGMASTVDDNGYLFVASDGGIFAFGDAQFHGSTGALVLNKPIVGRGTDRGSGGYWLVGSDGGVFAFDAPFLGAG